MTDGQTKGRKLLDLYLRGVGGERINAGRLLTRHLREHDLTLYDLDPSLPVSQELSHADQWRESASLVAQLPGDASGEILTRLIDAPDLTPGEVAAVLRRLDLGRLVSLRAPHWASDVGAPEREYVAAAGQVTPEQVLAGSGSVAQRLRAAADRQYWRATHPERLIRTAGPIEQRAVLGMVRGLSGHPGWADPQGVRAHLSADQLARLRAVMAQHLQGVTDQALARALDVAETLGAERTRNSS